jgi:hypothetical protein
MINKVLIPQTYVDLPDLGCPVYTLWLIVPKALFKYLAFHSFDLGCTQ